MNRGNSQGNGEPVVRSTREGTVVIHGSTIELRHRNGMRERVGRGRYVMTDAQGRTIINRRATRSDLARLRRIAD
ncbi:hypothetical protein [Chelativorans sp.]|uniref:hypothetical protein n=1 Tax=Chelativorans sp. TaxID=2203393 RepID=UPI0028111D5C|nr:hypothetical protein [Chelativorans sp.]